MTDRGIPSPDVALACPFVAFDDDRDARSTAPDHRHRCFAEPVPAPRALAHQDAYCLSPAFAVCPAFQDWARREAAAARPGPSAPEPAPRPRDDEAAAPFPVPPAERGPLPGTAPAPRPPAERRAASRDWTAPPPWIAEGDTPAPSPAAPAPGAVPGWGVAPAPDAAPARPRRDDWGDASRGLADSAAARLAGAGSGLPAPARPARAWSPQRDDAPDDADAYDREAEDEAPALPPTRPQSVLSRTTVPRPVAGSSRPGRPVPAPRIPPAREGTGPMPLDPSELFGPAWERPRRHEGYPSLRTRVGLPSLRGMSSLALAAIALVVAAAFLFAVSPMILGLGKDRTPAAEVSASPSLSASAVPSESPVPTLAPAPTQTVYTVKAGDTLSKIAAKFGVTVKDVLKANPQIKNQNAIQIGDPITIPVSPGGSSISGASPSAVSGASAAP